jgi:hypothetical protein
MAYIFIDMVKGKFHPKTLHVGPEGENRNSPTLSLTSVVVGDQRQSTAVLSPG